MSNTSTAPDRELARLLTQAAELAATQQLDADDFMSAAWDAYLDAIPGLRQHLADKELKKELKKLRKQGLIATA